MKSTYAVAFILRLRKAPLDYMPQTLRTATYRATYQENLPVIDIASLELDMGPEIAILLLKQEYYEIDQGREECEQERHHRSDNRVAVLVNNQVIMRDHAVKHIIASGKIHSHPDVPPSIPTHAFRAVRPMRPVRYTTRFVPHAPYAP